MHDLCLTCEDGPGLWRPVSQSIRLGECNESQPHPSLGLHSHRNNYRCPHPPEKTCADIGIGERVRVRGLLSLFAAERDLVVIEPEICLLTAALH